MVSAALLCHRSGNIIKRNFSSCILCNIENDNGYIVHLIFQFLHIQQDGKTIGCFVGGVSNRVLSNEFTCSNNSDETKKKETRFSSN